MGTLETYSPFTTFAKAEYQGVARLFYTQAAYANARSLTHPVSGAPVVDPTIFDKYVKPSHIDLDLLIQGIDFTYKERSQIEPMLGDYVSLNFFGKSPMVLSIKASLVDTVDSEGKKTLMTLYSKLLRISQVAKLGVAPYIDFIGFFVQGAFLSLGISETSANDNVLNITAQFLVFNMKLKNQENTWQGVKSVDILYNKAGWTEPDQDLVSDNAVGLQTYSVSSIA
jgi:hypothetical protein